MITREGTALLQKLYRLSPKLADEARTLLAKLSPEATAELHYPDRRKPAGVRVSLYDTRAADDLLITYDFTRDGWAIHQPTRHEWNCDEDADERWREVAFCPAWQFLQENGGADHG